MNKTRGSKTNQVFIILAVLRRSVSRISEAISALLRQRNTALFEEMLSDDGPFATLCQFDRPKNGIDPFA